MYENRIFQALVHSHYLYYAIFAYFVFFLRVVLRTVTRREIALAALFVAGIALEIFQLVFDSGKTLSFTKMETASFQRYFGCMAPLLWGWTAYGVCKLSGFPGLKGAVLKVAAAAGLFYVAVVDGGGFFFDFYRKGLGEDALVAARRISHVVKRDYAGERVRPNMKYSVREYFTANRPAVFSNFGVLALLVNGQSEGPNHGIYPYPPDYLFLNMNCGGYAQGGKRFKPDDYEFVAETRGSVCRWVLFRRKGVPHRLKSR